MINSQGFGVLENGSGHQFTVFKVRVMNILIG